MNLHTGLSGLIKVFFFTVATLFEQRSHVMNSRLLQAAGQKNGCNSYLDRLQPKKAKIA